MIEGLRLASLAAAAVLLWTAASPAGALALDAFLIEDVRVDTTADSAAEAHEQALVDGQRAAFQRLVARLVLRGERAKLRRPSDSQIADLVQDLQVRDEKSSAVRYLARLAFRFKPDAVRALLQAVGARFVETPSKRLLVLPVYRLRRTRFLWDDPNPWRVAWSDLMPRDGLVRFVVPVGDLGDLQAIDVRQAIGGDVDALRTIAKRYDAGEVLLAIATERASVDPERPAVQATLSRFGVRTRQFTPIGTFAGAYGPDLAAIYAATASALAEEVEERWKRNNLAFSAAEQRLVVTVPFADLGGWLAFQKRLASVAIVRASRVLELSRNRALLELEYRGLLDQLRLALGENAILLTRAEAPRGPAGLDARPGAARGPAHGVGAAGSRWILRLGDADDGADASKAPAQ